MPDSIYIPEIDAYVALPASMEKLEAWREASEQADFSGIPDDLDPAVAHEILNATYRRLKLAMQTRKALGK